MGHERLSSFAMIDLSFECDLSYPVSVDIDNFIENLRTLKIKEI